MTATTRQFISALLSLLLVISGPALAMSKITDSKAGIGMADCGSTMMAQAESASSSSDGETETSCVSASDKVCLSASGLSKCGVSFVLLPGNSLDLTDIGSQAVLTGRAALYQDPFLASITPPPQNIAPEL